MSAIGTPLNRVDGRAKVTGTAPYTGEQRFANLAYGALVGSTISRGRIRRIDTRAADSAPGVLAILTHRNMPKLSPPGDSSAVGTMPAEKRTPLLDDRIHHAGQHVAIVVADTFERARHAASLVAVEYDEEPPAVELEPNVSRAYRPESFFGGMAQLQTTRGNPAQAMGTAEARLEGRYVTPTEHHNPMEPHATVAVWEGNRLTLYDSTQAIAGTHAIMAGLLGLPPDDVRILCPFVGGGFGSKGLVWGHPLLAAVAARQARRPVKVVLHRRQMFTSVGHRGRTVQQVALGASRDGALVAHRHETLTHQSEISDFLEPAGLTARMLYACPNMEMSHQCVRLNVGSPTPMRAPGESPGTFALESALDELAYRLGMDPVALRVRNHTDTEPHDNKPFSSKHLLECYRLGAERFGWQRRTPEPRSMRDGRWLVGYGMATATYPGYRQPASARCRLLPDGTAVVETSSQDIGTGTYTIMCQIAADALGLPVERVKARLGDSSLPVSPTSGGSATAASIGPAVHEACLKAKAELARLASVAPASLASPQAMAAAARRVGKPVEACVASTTVAAESQAKAKNPAVKAGSRLRPPCAPVPAQADMDMDSERWAFQSFGAQFAEVGVDPDLGLVRVRRFTSVHDIGRVLNPKTARSQAISGVMYGIGMALTEETVYDPKNGRPVTRNLADYHVPCCADAPAVDVHFIDKPDPHFNSLGVRGVGEIGITGVAAAIANAVYHATGRRLRELPLTPDKLLL